LLSAVQPPDPPPLPITPDKKDLIGDRSRWETMQTFVEDERLVSAVREKLERYCREVLELAVGEIISYGLSYRNG